MNRGDKSFGNSILHAVAYNDIAVSARALLIKGANPNAQNYHLETPLHWCCKTNAVKCATLLINNGAFINAIDNSGSSPLHLVAAYGASIELAALLLDNGIDSAIIDLDGKKAIDIAFENKNNGPGQSQLYDYLHARSSIVAESMQGDSDDFLLSAIANTAKVSIHKKKMVKVTGNAGSRTAVVTKKKPEKVAKKLDFIEELLRDDVFTRPVFRQVDDVILESHYSPSPVTADPLLAVKVAATKFVEDIIDNRRQRVSKAATTVLPAAVTTAAVTGHRSKPIREPDRDEKDVSAPASPSYKLASTRSKSAPILQSTASSSAFAIRKVEQLKPIFMSTPVEGGDSMDDKLCTVIGVLPDAASSLTPSLLKEISRQKDQIAQHFPPAKYVPFLPSNPEHLDVYIAVEQCTDCSGHSWNLWHDERKYSSYGDVVIAGLISQLVLKEYPIKLYAYKSKPEHARLGACDVTIAVFTENKPSSSGIDGNSFQTGWITHTLHSKIETSRWPSLKQVVKQAVKFLKVILVLYNNSQLKCSAINERYMVDALRENLGSWMLRTKTDLTRSRVKYDKSVIHPVILSKSLVNAQEAAAAKIAEKAKNSGITISFDSNDPDIEIKDDVTEPRPEAVPEDTSGPTPTTRNVQYLNIPPSKEDLKSQEALMAWEADILTHCFVYSLSE